MALGKDTFSDVSGAVGDLFAASGYGLKAQGAEFEKKNYLLASSLADQNALYTEESTRLKELQADRQAHLALGETSADVAGAGFAASGSALDLMADSASQGALHRALLTEQGVITEAGFKEQADSYRNMASAAQTAIDAENKAAFGSEITAGIKGAAAIATLVA